MASKRNDQQETRAVRLMRAVESAREALAAGGAHQTEPAEHVAAVGRPKSRLRAIQFPKDTNALRRYVTDVQARPSATPTKYRIRLLPTKADGERPQASAALRQRVEQARRIPRAWNEPSSDEVRPGIQEDAGVKFNSVRDVGRLIRERRLEVRMSQSRLALIAGTGRRFISELEAGKLTAELGKVLAVCHALGFQLTAEPHSRG